MCLSPKSLDYDTAAIQVHSYLILTGEHPFHLNGVLPDVNWAYSKATKRVLSPLQSRLRLAAGFR